VLTGNKSRPPHNHEGCPPATKLLAVLTGNTDATGSPKHPSSINPHRPATQPPTQPSTRPNFHPPRRNTVPLAAARAWAQLGQLGEVDQDLADGAAVGDML
jgi:hypothetical protein